MPNLKPKKLSVQEIQATYDLLIQHFEQNPDRIAGDASAKSHVSIVFEEKLREIGYPRVDNLSQLITSHEAKVARGAANRTTPSEASDTMADLYKAVVGQDLARPTNKDPQGSEEVLAEADETKSVSSASTTATDAAMPEVFRISVAGSEALLDPTIGAVSGQRISKISDLLKAVEVAETAKADADAVIAAYKGAISEAQAGHEVTEDGLGEIAGHEPSGFADLPTDGPMVPVLDAQIAQNIEPATTYSDLISRLAQAESGVTEGRSQLKGLRRDLRRAQPRQRVQVGMPTSAPTTSEDEANTLAEIDQINGSCTVVQEVAADLFPACYGANPEILGFEVPRLEFDDEHPDVPKIDETFRFYTGVLVEALSAIADNENTWLYGESGCGKSAFCEQVAARLGMPFTRINLDAHLTRTDIVGGMKLVPDGKGGSKTVFVEGALPYAMARPGLLLLDEFDLGDPEIMPIFQPLLEGKNLVLLEDGGRIVRRHPEFRIIVTGNTTGLGSDNQMYLNAFEQSAATRDRFAAFVEMPYMPADIEKEVVMARLPDADEDFVERMIALANKVRDGYRNGEIQTLFSTRAVQFCATRHRRFAPLYPDPAQAADEIIKAVILNRLDRASHAVVKELADNIFA